MATGIIRIVVGSAVAALALAAPALAVPTPSEGDAVALKPTATTGYDAAALEAMGARYQAMAAYYLEGNDATFRLSAKTGWNPVGSAQQTRYDAAAQSAMGARHQALADYYRENAAMFRLGDQSALNTAGSNNAPIVDDRVAPDGSQPQLHGTESGSAFVGPETPDGFQPQLHGRQAVPASDGDGTFDWGIFGIATGSALLAAALGGTVLIATRTRGRVAHP